MNEEIGTEEYDVCNLNGCDGKLYANCIDQECYCSITSSVCNYCTADLICDVCKRKVKNEHYK